MEDVPLPDLRPRLIDAMLPHVAFDGWSSAALRAGAADVGIDPDVAALAFDGPADMVDAYIARADAAMLAACDTDAFRALKIRARVTEAIWTRLEQAAPHREAARRAAALLTTHPVVAARTLARTADAIWRAAGDTATDFNWYSKRGLAAAVYASTLLRWLADDSEGFAETRAFLERRIDNVMAIEKLKAKRPADGFSVARFLGRLRYPVR
jgi:ubiquinone biosynthesis protein COQ9